MRTEVGPLIRAKVQQLDNTTKRKRCCGFTPGNWGSAARLMTFLDRWKGRRCPHNHILSESELIATSAGHPFRSIWEGQWKHLLDMLDQKRILPLAYFSL